MTRIFRRGWFGGLSVLLFSAAVARAELDLWFLVASDPHYKAEAEKDAKTRRNVARMNGIPGKTFFDGTTIGTPAGVLMLGDLADSPTLAQWKLFVEDFGLTGREGALKYPVYEGWGNHDVQGMPSHTSSLVLKRKKDGDPDGIFERNPNRIFVWNGVTNKVHLAPEGYVYSWDWGPVHLIQCGYGPYVEPDPARKQMKGKNYNSTGAFQFMVDSLKKHVGDSRRPVILMHHLDVNSGFGWTQAEVDKYYEAVKGYNVIAVMYGHTSTGVGAWKVVQGGKEDRTPVIRTVNTGNLGAGFWVAHVTDEAFSIAYTTGEKDGQPEWSPRHRGRWAIEVPAGK